MPMPTLTRLGASTTPEQRLLARQFAQFAAIGVVGFGIDNTVVYAVSPTTGPYWAGAISYGVVGVIIWLLNRIWTYRHLSHAAMHRQLIMFLLANSVGFILNRGTYFTLVASVPLCRSYLVLPIAAGAGAGMFVNFFLSRRLVFR